MPSSPIPDGYTSVTPYLIVRDAANAIDFYKRAFDAVELVRLAAPDGSVGHAELRIGNAVVMLADEMPEMGHRGPLSLGGTAVSLLLYVDDVDRRFERALAEGAEAKRAVADQFYGDRSGTLVDPFGHSWSLATHIEDVPIEEVRRRYEAMVAEAKGGDNARRKDAAE